jgi:sigma-B regulation protein RsbU (phosphoserine phosphatase)
LSPPPAATASSGTVRSVEPLRLESIAGPPIEPILISAESPILFGRSSGSDQQLTDKTVSRRHCRVSYRGTTWFITDLGSRHGTFLNGIRLEAEQPAPLTDGDLMRIGPWTFRTRVGGSRATSLPTTNDLASTAHRVQRVPVRELRSVAQQRLDLLVECAASINGAISVEALADQVLDAVMRGTGFNRAAFIRQVSATGDVEVIGYRGPDVDPTVSPSDPTASGPKNEAPANFTFSRSLINAASNGEIVRMAADSGVNYGESVIRLGIHSALCAPIMLGSSVEAYLYLDARDSESSVQQDAAAFCQAISKMAGLALANLKRIELQGVQDTLKSDLKAAREAQRLIMPPAMGTLGRVTYAMQTRPGRMVAGDLFDIIPLDGDDNPDGRIAVFLGDVAGKGVGAAVLMATAQTHLRMALRHADDPGVVVRDANRYVTDRIGDGLFISLWLGIIDPKEATLRFVDAGHGHWLIAPPGEPAKAVPCEGGLVVGVQGDFDYQTESVPFAAGSRLILFSDGLVEQPNPSGELFRVDRAIRALAKSAAPREDVKALAAAVRDHAETDVLADDFTIASVSLDR